MRRVCYKLRDQPSGPGGTSRSYLLGVPAEIGVRLIALGRVNFQIELTEEGILYRPIGPADPPEGPRLPSWMQEGVQG